MSRSKPAVDSQELAVDSQELAVDSQELAVDSQELAVRTGGCRIVCSVQDALRCCCATFRGRVAARSWPSELVDAESGARCRMLGGRLLVAAAAAVSVDVDLDCDGDVDCDDLL